MLKFENKEGIEFMAECVPDNSVHLILTDPPYIISRDTGMDKLHKTVAENEKKGVLQVKSEEEWLAYKQEHMLESDEKKENYIKYGTVYGKKYCVRTQYGEWDTDFSMETMETFVEQFYKKLVAGGTVIIFFDLWKITPLKQALEKYKFKQIRFIEWIKTNPQPLNSSVNYLTNCREIALLAVKGSKPTFNSSYDNGIYSYPIQGGKSRNHPTQKNRSLFEDIICKHSNEGDVVMDTFLGSGTTMFAALNHNRQFIGCEMNPVYFQNIVEEFSMVTSKS